MIYVPMIVMTILLVGCLWFLTKEIFGPTDRWRTEYRCVKCKCRMSDGVKMYSSGRCPGCGYKAPGACTIVSTTEHAYRHIKTGGWIWPFATYEKEYQE